MPSFFNGNLPGTDLPKLDISHEIPTPQNTELSDPFRVLASWVAPSRPFRKKDRSYYTTVTILIILLVLIAFLIQEYFLIGVLLALMFVIYVLGFVPPEDLDYKISSQGITVGDHFYLWNNLDSFWISQKEGSKVLNVLTHLRFPAQLIIPLGDGMEDEVKKAIVKYLPFHEIPPKTLMDSWTEVLQKYFPLENPHKV